MELLFEFGPHCHNRNCYRGTLHISPAFDKNQLERDVTGDPPRNCCGAPPPRFLSEGLCPGSSRERNWRK